MAISILGIGTVCALGSGIESLKDGLQGKIKPLIEEHSINTADGEISLPVYKPVVEGIDRFIPKRLLRRIDSFAQMALLSTYLSIEDSGIQFEDKKRIGVVFGSGYGPIRTTFKFLDNIIDDGDVGASPTYFANSVHNALSSQASIFLKTTGPCSTVTCFNHTVSNVLLTAKNWLNEGAVDYVLAGFGDEYCDVLGYASASYATSEPSEIKPLDFDTCSFLPGEGHITFLLSNDSFKKGKYGKIDDIVIRKKVSEINDNTLNSAGAVFLSANGNNNEGKSFKKLCLEKTKVAAYSPLYGGMPVGSSFDIAIAALSLKEKTLYPSLNIKTGRAIGPNVISTQESIGLNSCLCCLEFCGKDEFNIFTLSG